MTVGKTEDLTEFSPQPLEMPPGRGPSRNPTDMLRPLDQGPPQHQGEEAADLSDKNSKPPGEKARKDLELPGNFLFCPFYDAQPPPLEVDETRSAGNVDEIFVNMFDVDEDDTLFAGDPNPMPDDPPPRPHPLDTTSVLTTVEPIVEEVIDKAVETKLQSTSASVFDEEDPSDLFSVQKKPEKPAVSATEKSKSLFDDDPDDEDLFSGTTTSRPTTSSLTGKLNNYFCLQNPLTSFSL